MNRLSNTSRHIYRGDQVLVYDMKTSQPYFGLVVEIHYYYSDNELKVRVQIPELTTTVILGNGWDII